LSFTFLVQRIDPLLLLQDAQVALRRSACSTALGSPLLSLFLLALRLGTLDLACAKLDFLILPGLCGGAGSSGCGRGLQYLRLAAGRRCSLYGAPFSYQ
jgi:hypothetical protein